MTPAKRRRVARVLREAARHTAHSRECCGMITAIERVTRMLEGPAWRAVVLSYGNYGWMPLDEPHRHLRVMMLLFAAEAVLTGDCDD